MSRRLAVFALVSLVLLALVLAGCATVPTAGAPSKSTATVTPVAAAKPLNLAIGQPANYSGLKVTMLAAGPGPVDYGGKPTYKISVKYENGSKQTASFNTFDWKIEDTQGARTQDSAMLEGSPATLGSGDLAPGGSKQGDLYFTMPSPVAKVVYQASLFGGEESLATWTAK